MQLQSVTYRGRSGAERALLPGIFTDTHEFRFAEDTGVMQVQSIDFPAVGATLARVRSTGHTIRLTERDRLSMLLPQSGKLEIETAGMTRAIGVGSRFLSAPSHPRVTRTGRDGAADYSAFVVIAPPGTFGLAAEGFGSIPAHAAAADAVSRTSATAASYLSFLFADLALDCPVLARPNVVAAAEHLLVELVRETLLEAGLGEPEASPALVPIVQRAEAYMHANYATVTGVADVASATGVGLRWLQRAFCEVRGHSPREALNRIRMSNARRRLLAAATGASVTNIALDCGFTHLGRFAGAYRTIYGEVPSQTVRRHRS